jgi:GNAT superfamily N-acetyltransferase
VPEVVRLDEGAWERLRAIRLRALEDEPDAFGSSLEAEVDRGESAWRELLAGGPWWIAVEAEDDVGLVAGGTHRGATIPWVYSMWVATAWRGSGIAQQLIDAVVAWARASGAHELGLDVTDRVPRARRFYERCGFVATGVSERMPRDDTIVLFEMVLALDAQDHSPPRPV